MDRFTPQKVLHLKDELSKKKPKLQGNYFISEKYDGWYVYVEFKKETGFWYAPLSSKGRMIPALAWTVDIFNKLPRPHDDCILIAEVIVPDTPFHITNGLLNRSVGNFACKDIVFMVHDIVLPSSNISAGTRLKYMNELCVEGDEKYIKPIIPLYLGEYNKNIWELYFDKIINSGGEGIVAKREDSMYNQGKRNSDLLKLKLEISIDALAVRLEESIGERGLPGLTLISKRSNGTEIRTIIGKHEDQKLFRENADNVIGKVVEIKGMEELDDGQLRQPVFKCIRDDKNTYEID